MSTNVPPSQPESEMSEDEVRQTLLKAGLNADQIDLVFAKAHELEQSDMPESMQTLVLDMMTRKMISDNQSSS